MKKEYLLGGALLLLTAGIGGTIYYSHNSKAGIIKRIMYKYGDKNSPDYSANFEATPVTLNKLDITTLKKLYSGELR